MHHFQSIDSDEEMDSDDTENDPTYMQSEGEDDGSSFEEECSSSDESKVIIRITMHMDKINTCISSICDRTAISQIYTR